MGDVIALSAEQVYGAGPLRGGPATGPKTATDRVPAASPQAAASPVAGLADDPTFWLVVMVGVAAGLAIYSAP